VRDRSSGGLRCRRGDPADHDPADRLAALGLPTEARGVCGDGAPFGDQVAALGLCGPERGELTIEALPEPVLFPVGVRRGERVLPLPDEHGPAERQDARDDQEDAADPCQSGHAQP
jgi:hypothetical protein